METVLTCKWGRNKLSEICSEYFNARLHQIGKVRKNERNGPVLKCTFESLHLTNTKNEMSLVALWNTCIVS
jgi:hypothetical protein